MNNHNHHNHNYNEQRQDENPFEYILKRALLHREDASIDTARYMSAIPEYGITIEHGSIRNALVSPQAIVASTRITGR